MVRVVVRDLVAVLACTGVHVESYLCLSSGCTSRRFAAADTRRHQGVLSKASPHREAADGPQGLAVWSSSARTCTIKSLEIQSCFLTFASLAFASFPPLAPSPALTAPLLHAAAGRRRKKGSLRRPAPLLTTTYQRASVCLVPASSSPRSQISA